MDPRDFEASISPTQVPVPAYIAPHPGEPHEHPLVTPLGHGERGIVPLDEIVP